MRKIVYIIVAFALLSTAQAFASKVHNVELTYKDGFTVAVINIDGAVRFSHQTEEAKDGKPYRVIVDVLSARHDLGAKNFKSLPNCPIKTIRSSQYAVTPENVVRMVFDMDTERVYRVDSDSKSITLYFSDNSTTQFASWSSKTFLASLNNEVPQSQPVKKDVTYALVKPQSKSVADLNKSIDSDRMSSLASTTPTPKKTAPSKPKVKPVTIPKPLVEDVVNPDGPEVSLTQLAIENQNKKNNDADKKAKELAKVSADKKAKEVAKVAADKKAKELAKVTADKKAKEFAKVAADKKAKELAKVAADKKAKELAKVAADKKAKELAKVTADKKAKELAKVTADKKAKEVAKVTADKKAKKLAKAAPVKKAASNKAVAQVNDSKKKKSTSRFRRNPASKKIQGTMVAQFPKRLVIKYKSKSYRDPFATLIDESRNYNDPIEKRVPNVEGLKLVGIIQADTKNDNRALFEDSDGYGYILKSGDKVRRGYVLRVDASRVYFQVFEYGWSRTIALNLES